MQVELKALVRLHEGNELVPSEQLAIDHYALSVDAAPDALEGHLEAVALADEEALCKPLHQMMLHLMLRYAPTQRPRHAHDH